MTDEKLITAALKMDADQIHLPDGLLTRIEQEAGRIAPRKPRHQLRLGAIFEVLAAGLILGAMLTVAAMGAFDRQPAAPQEGPAPAPVRKPVSVDLPRLTPEDITLITIRWTHPEPKKLITEETAPLTAVLGAFNQAQARTREVATSPLFTVELQLRSGEPVQLSVIDQETVFARVEGESVEIRSPALVRALEELPDLLRVDRHFTVAIDLVDGRGGYTVHGVSPQDVKVAMVVAGQTRQQVDAPVEDGWYSAFLKPPLADELEKAQIVITAATGESLASLPALPPYMVGTSYNLRFEEVQVVSGHTRLQIRGKTKVADGRFRIDVRAGGKALASQDVTADGGSFNAEVRVPGGLPEKTEVWLVTISPQGAEQVEMALPVLYLQ